MNPFILVLIILWMVLVVVFVLFLVRRSKEKSQPKKFSTEFNQTALNIGLSKTQVKEIKNLLAKSGITKPFLVFSDASLLDQVIADNISGMDKAKVSDVEKEKAILNLFEIKRIIHNHFLDMSEGVRSTQEIEANQLLNLKLPGVGNFYSIVIVNDKKNLICNMPEIKDPMSIPWKDKTVEVYFWRFNDAGYVFNTVIENVVYNKRMQVLVLQHKNNIKRIQRREYPRRKCRFNSKFFKFSLSTNEAGKPVILLGRTQFGVVIDISPGGLSMASDEVLPKNQSVKMEVTIGEDLMVAYGTIINAVKKKNMYIMHVQFQRITDHNKNIIYRYVYRYV